MSANDWFTTRILVVDDNDRVRDAMCMRVGLSCESYVVRGARNGAEALRLLDEEGFDVVLCDLVLSGEPDGAATTVAIRERHPGTRVVVFTGNETGERKIEVLKAGAFSYLAKPINHEELLHSIETIDSIRRTERLGQVFKTLARISHELQTILDSDLLPRRIVDAACELGYRRTRLYLYDAEANTLVGKASCGMGDDAGFEGFTVPLGANPLIAEIFRAHRPTVWNKRRILERYGADAAEPWMTRLGLAELTWIDVPLLAGHERIGTLAFDNGHDRKEHRYADEDLEVLDVFAGMAAHAVSNAQAYEKEALANASLSSILRDAPDAVVTTGLDGLVTFVSPSGERVIGHPADKMVGQPVYRFYTDPERSPDAGLRIARGLMSRLRKEGTVANLRLDLLPASGPPRPVMVSASLLHDDAGEAIGTLGIVKDVSALDAQSEQYRTVLEGFGYGTLVVSKRGNVQFVNRKALRLLKRAREDTVGRRFADMVLPAQRREVADACRRVVAGDGEEALDFSLLRGDASRLSISARLTPVRSQRGASGVAVALYDKGELSALIQSGRLMALGQMVAGIAHEINNPLNNMVVAVREMAARLDNEGTLSPKNRQYVEMIERNGGRIQGIVGQLRDFARPALFERVPLAVNQVIDDALAFFRSRFRHHDVEILTELAQDLPPVAGDANRLQQVLVNLIVNAEDAMEGQSEEKRLTIASRRRGERVEIDVCDTGCGIPDEIAEAIFDPFFTTKPPNQGTGLGLSISKSIMDLHEGEIRASRAGGGRGACFTLTLPAAGGDETQEGSTT
ncbi:MAG TPA: ATP-binding protein [Thermoanaerobaculia bacterium]